MHNRIGLVALSLFVAFAGCKSHDGAPVPDASAAAAPSASASNGDPKLTHCPSAVEGTNTSIRDTPGGIELSVTARDDSDTVAIAAIRARAAFFVDAARNSPDAAVHNGSGDLGGIFGRCPIVMRDTTVVATDTPTGSTIAVTARDPKETDWLRRESRSRVDELAAPAADDSAHVKEVHCPTTVAGAVLSVADVPGAVAVTITAKDSAAAKEIRDRGHALVAATKLGANGRAGGGRGGGGGGGGGAGGGGGHGHGDGTGPGPGDGTGNGAANATLDAGRDSTGSGAGGGFGKCPIVVKGTSLDALDRPDGVTFTLTPATPDALGTVRKQVHERITAAAASPP